MANKLLEEMELQNARLWAQFHERGNLLQAMSAVNDMSAMNDLPRRPLDSGVEQLTQSFQRLQSDNNLTLSAAQQHHQNLQQQQQQQQPAMSALLRKASTLARPGGKVSLNYKALLKDLVLSDHPGVRAALARVDVDDGKELREVLQRAAMEQYQHEAIRQKFQLEARQRLLSEGKEDSKDQASASAAEKLERKLQRLNNTQGGSGSSFGAPSIGASSFLSGFSFPAGHAAGDQALGAGTSSRGAKPPPLPSQQQQQHRAVGPASSGSSTAVAAAVAAAAAAAAAASAGPASGQSEGGLTQAQIQALLQHALPRPTQGGAGGAQTYSQSALANLLLGASPPATPAQQTAPHLSPQAPHQHAKNQQQNGPLGASNLSALQQALQLQMQSAGGASGLGSLGSSLFGGLQSLSSSPAAAGSMPPPLPRSRPNEAPTGSSTGHGSSIHFANLGDLGSKRSRPESMNNFVSFREPNRTRVVVPKDAAPPAANDAAAEFQALQWKIEMLQEQLAKQAQGGAASTMIKAEASPFGSPNVSPHHQAHTHTSFGYAAAAATSGTSSPAGDDDLDDGSGERPDIAVNTRNYSKSGKVSAAPRRWTPEEDEMLRDSVTRHKAKNWKAIAKDVPGRNHVQCLQRWRKALDPEVVKGHWRPEEDSQLLLLVAENPKNWGHVARGIPGRTAKQCRERYHNHLDPRIKKGDWTEEEDGIILEQQQLLGNKWAEISKFLPGRTENSVKIRWKSIQRLSSTGRSDSDKFD